MIARSALVLVTLAVLVWLGAMERNARLQQRGAKAILAVAVPASSAARADPARADADLRAARFLTADTTPDLLRSFLYRAEGKPLRALKLAKDITRREPDNLSAWKAVLDLSRRRDAATGNQARNALRRLDPVSAQRLISQTR